MDIFSISTLEQNVYLTHQLCVQEFSNITNLYDCKSWIRTDALTAFEMFSFFFLREENIKNAVEGFPFL